MPQTRRNLLLGAVGFAALPNITRSQSSITISGPDRLVYLPSLMPITDAIKLVRDKDIKYFIALVDREGKVIAMEDSDLPAANDNIRFR